MILLVLALPSCSLISNELHFENAVEVYERLDQHKYNLGDCEELGWWEYGSKSALICKLTGTDPTKWDSSWVWLEIIVVEGNAYEHCMDSWSCKEAAIASGKDSEWSSQWSSVFVYVGNVMLIATPRRHYLPGKGIHEGEGWKEGEKTEMFYSLKEDLLN